MPEQQVDQQVLEQARRQISGLLNEIRELAAKDLTSVDFYAEFLRRVITALAAPAGAVWVKTAQGNLQLQYQINLQVAGLHGNDYARKSHDELLREMVSQNNPQIVTPRSGAGAESGLSKLNNPTDFLLILAPILVDGNPVGVLEIFQDPNRQRSAYQGYMKFVADVAVEAANHIRQRQYKHLRGQEQLWNKLDNYIRTVHGGLRPKQVAYLVANEGRKVIQAERVSVAVQYGKKTVIEAISGQDNVEKRSNLVRTLGRLADRVLFYGENLVFNGTMEEHWPAGVKVALERYIEESNSKMVIITPIRDTREFGDKEAKPTVSLITEMIEDTSTPDEFVGRIEAVCRHGGLALYNSIEHSTVFLLPVWQAIGKTTRWLNAYTMPKIGMVFAAITVVILVLTFLPWPLRLEGKGSLEPEVRRTIYAPVTGRVGEVRVDHNAPTDAGTLLLVMRDPNLEQRLVDLQGQLAAAELKYRNLESMRVEGQANQEKMMIDRGTQKFEIAKLRGQIAVLTKNLEDLNVRSPIKGRVLDWNPVEKLAGRPVQQGDPLIEVADTSGRWLGRVKLPENTVTHIIRAQARDGQQLPVTFVLSAQPDTVYNGKLVRFATQAQSVEQENFVEAEIELDPSQTIPPELFISGVEMRAKVNCGPHPLGYVLLRELIDFVREYVFF